MVFVYGGSLERIEYLEREYSPDQIPRRENRTVRMRLHQESVGLGFDWMVTFARHIGMIVHQIDVSVSICEGSFDTIQGISSILWPSSSCFRCKCCFARVLVRDRVYCRTIEHARTHTLAVDQGCRRMTIQTLAGLEWLKNVVSLLKDRLLETSSPLDPK